MSKNLEPTVFESIHLADSLVVCCFFTDSYLSHALSLKESLDKLGLSYYLKSVEDAGYWEANTRIKPHFIKECLEAYPNKNILYLDADSVVKKSLSYFDSIDADICAYATDNHPGMSHDYLTGTIFFTNNQATSRFMEAWMTAQEGTIKTLVDQDSFDEAVKNCANNIKIQPLPTGYIKIFDKAYQGDIFIEHYQASRSQTKLRRQNIRTRNRIIGGGVLVIIALIAYSMFS